MNERAAEALYEAERNGVRQIKGEYAANGGMCAMEVLRQARQHVAMAKLLDVPGCPLCGAAALINGTRLTSEGAVVVHLNDDHDLTFSEIARKLGPDSA